MYDAWGTFATKVLDQSKAELVDLNPFTYRGYYYDKETGLYYLQSRYYDPELGRFISQDSIEYADPETINGINLYAYCGNNPVMNVDPTGHEWYDVLFKVIAGIALVVTGVLATVFTGGVAGFLAAVAFSAALGGFVGGIANEAQGGSFMAGWIGGAVNGAIQGIGMQINPFFGAIIGGGIGSFTGTIITQHIDRGLGNNLFSNIEIIENATNAAIASGLTSILTGYMAYAINFSIGSVIGGAAIDGISGSILTEVFANLLSGFFGAIDDGLAYYITWRFRIVRFKG